MVHQHPRPAAMDEPATKRARTDDGSFGAGEAALPGMMGEQQWISAHPGPIVIVVKVANVQQEKESTWPLNGQSLRLTLSMSDSVKTLKDKAGEQLNAMPANKMKLQLAPFGTVASFLLACNISDALSA